MDDSGWHVLLNKVLHYQSESSGCCRPSVGIFWILLLAPWSKKKEREISSHSFKQLNLWMRPWFCRIKPDLRLKTVENCWRQDQFQVQVVMGTLMASRFRGREFSKKIKALSSNQDLSCWLTPESAHAPDTLAAWWVQLCQGTQSTAWDSFTLWEVSSTQELL